MEEFGVDENWKTDIILGTVLGILFTLFIRSDSLFGFGIPLFSSVFGFGTPYGITSYLSISTRFIVVVLAAPILEETLFRGALMTLITNMSNTTIGIIISSIGFALFHWNVYGGMALSASLMGAGIFGVISCIVMLYTNSLIPPVIMHAIVNFSIFSEQIGWLSIG